MEFLKHCDNKNIVMECSEDIVVSEGWGIFLSKSVLGSAADMIGNKLNAKKLNEMISKPEVANYIKGECERILKEQQKENPNVDKISADGKIKHVVALLKSRYKDDTIVGIIEKKNHWRAYFSENDNIGSIIGGFRIEILYDDKHIQKIILYLYDKEKNKYYLFNIPAPTDEELSKIFHKE